MAFVVEGANHTWTRSSTHRSCTSERCTIRGLWTPSRCSSKSSQSAAPRMEVLQTPGFKRPDEVVNRAFSLKASEAPQLLQTETDPRGLERLTLRPQGWQFWDWQRAPGEHHKIGYLQAGNKGPPVVLVHGFGASAYHWRYNIPYLAKKHRVFAVDLLGFGWSEKALVDYDGYQVWPQQLGDFIKEKVSGEAVVLVGNSLGGYNSLATAAKYPELVRGVVLINGAGKFDAESLQETAAEQLQDEVSVSTSGTIKQVPAEPVRRNGVSAMMGQMIEPVMSLMKRGVIYGSFVLTKQPSRIRQVLQQVYPADCGNVDEDLVKSIMLPAQDANAAEVFYRTITGSGPSINGLLKQMRSAAKPADMLLLWGDLDPWIGPRSADRVMQLYPAAQRTRIQAGHCPHDELPQEVNAALEAWLDKLV